MENATAKHNIQVYNQTLSETHLLTDHLRGQCSDTYMQVTPTGNIVGQYCGSCC